MRVRMGIFIGPADPVPRGFEKDCKIYSPSTGRKICILRLAKPFRKYDPDPIHPGKPLRRCSKIHPCKGRPWYDPGITPHPKGSGRFRDLKPSAVQAGKKNRR